MEDRKRRTRRMEAVAVARDIESGELEALSVDTLIDLQDVCDGEALLIELCASNAAKGKAEAPSAAQPPAAKARAAGSADAH